MTTELPFISIQNGEMLPLERIPSMPAERLRLAIMDAIRSPSTRVLAFFAVPDETHTEGHPNKLIAVLGNTESHSIEIASAPIEFSYRAFTPEIPALHWFEREIAEQYGIIPQGHPWLKPIRFHKSYNESHDAWDRPRDEPIEPAVTHHFEMSGDAAHEVAVGPVHAGVIEPGHFRFQCLGEDVHHLEISLGFQHRGIEKMMEGGPDIHSLHYAETASGDTTIASAWNYASIVEALTGVIPSTETMLLRSIMLELERMANHIGDLGALAGDVAFLPTASYCGRIRGDYLNMTAEIAGNRFGRNVVIPSGMRKTFSAVQAKKMLMKMREVKKELDNALALMFDESSVLDRFENTGTVNATTAREIGLVGVAGRASGLAIDARTDFPHTGTSGIIPLAMESEGDVFSRAKIRRDEIEASHVWLFQTLESLAESGLTETAPSEPRPLAANALAISITEAWRGELVHLAITDDTGRFIRYKIVDPFFHNWFGLALALRGEQISHFPVCNKSFSLSYCGHDL